MFLKILVGSLSLALLTPAFAGNTPQQVILLEKLGQNVRGQMRVMDFGVDSANKRSFWVYITPTYYTTDLALVPKALREQFDVVEVDPVVYDDGRGSFSANVNGLAYAFVEKSDPKKLITYILGEFRQKGSVVRSGTVKDAVSSEYGYSGGFSIGKQNYEILEIN